MGLAAAIGIAEVAFSVTAVLQSVAIVGAVVSVVGTVTKDKTLSMIGAGLGLVGGIGALASGALGLSSTSLLGTEVAGGASGAAGGVAGAAEGAIGSAVAGEGGWTVAAPDVVGSLVSDGAATFNPATTFNNPAAGLGVAPAGDAPTGLINASTSTAEPAAGAAAAVPDANVATVTPTTPAAATESIAAPVAEPAVGTPVGTNGWQVAEPDKGILSTLMDYAGKHPTIAFGAVQGASSLLSGWTSTLTPAQVAALNAQAAANQAASNLTAQQTANLAMPKAVATSAPVTGTPQTLVPGGQPPPPGFINQAPPTVAVTGKAA